MMSRILFKLALAAMLAVLIWSIFEGDRGGDPDNPRVKTVLKVWAMGAEAALLEQLSPRFEQEYPDIRVNVQAIPWEQVHNKLVTAVASMTGPDVFQMGTSWIPEFADAGVLVDLTPHLERFPNMRPEHFFPSSLETATYNGKYVGVPWYIENRVLFYRTDLLTAVGYPQGPSTWHEFRDAAAALSNIRAGRFGVSLDTETATTILMFAWQNEADPMAGGKPRFDQPEFIEAVDFLMALIRKGYAPKQSDYIPLQGFADGTFAMLFSGPWTLDAIRKNVPFLDGRWNIRVLPRHKTQTSYLGGANLSIFEASTNKEAALKYLEYLSRPDTQLRWYKISRSLPARLDVWQDEDLNTGRAAVFGAQMQDARPAPFIPEWESIERELLKSLERIRLGKADTRAEMEKLNKRVEHILSRN